MNTQRKITAPEGIEKARANLIEAAGHLERTPDQYRLPALKPWLAAYDKALAASPTTIISPEDAEVSTIRAEVTAKKGKQPMPINPFEIDPELVEALKSVCPSMDAEVSLGQESFSHRLGLAYLESAARAVQRERGLIEDEPATLLGFEEREALRSYRQKAVAALEPITNADLSPELNKTYKHYIADYSRRISDVALHSIQAADLFLARSDFGCPDALKPHEAEIRSRAKQQLREDMGVKVETDAPNVVDLLKPAAQGRGHGA